MADAEVKLIFTAQVEQARAAIAEVAAAMEKLQASGGVMRPEDAALLNEMQGQLAAYKARLDELSTAYQQLQASGGRANDEAIAQIKELQEQVATLTRQQEALVDKVVSLQVENNKLTGGVKEVATETEKAGQSGVRVTRSLRGVIAGFVKDLIRGKVSVHELGLALSGLAKSTGILLAIDLAVRGIVFLFGKLKDAIFGTEEEAENLQEALDKVAEKAKDAADSLQESYKKAHDEQAAAKVRQDAAALSAEYERQAAALRESADAVQRQARAEANLRALKASDEDHALAMKRLELDTQLADGKITQMEYRDALLALDEEKAKMQAQRVRDEADANFNASQKALELANKELENARKAWAAAQDKLDGMVTPERIERQADLITSIQASLDRVMLDVKENGRTDANAFAQNELERQLQKAQDKLYSFTNTADEYNAVKAEVARLRERFDAATAAQREASGRNTAAYDARGFAYAQAWQQERQAGEERRTRGELNAVQDRAERSSLRGKVAKLAQDAQRAAKTKDDTRDDTAALKAISDFIKGQGDEIEQYGINVRSLIDVCRKLSSGNDKVKTRVDSLAREIKALQRQVDKRTAKP